MDPTEDAEVGVNKNYTIKLETERDRHMEQLVIRRIFSDNPEVQWFPCAEFSAVDYIGVRDGKVVKVAEIKTRKQSKAAVMQYPGGLILKRRKYEELVHIEQLLNVPTYVYFGFTNGTGHIMQFRPWEFHQRHDDEIPDHDLGRRDRNLATDLEPVVLLNWGYDLIPLLDPLDGAE